MENRAAGTCGRGAAAELLSGVVTPADAVLVVAGGAGSAAVVAARGRWTGGAVRVVRALVVKGARVSYSRWMFCVLRSISYC